MKILKLIVSASLLAALFLGCVALPAVTTRPDPTGTPEITTVPAQTTAPTDPTDGTTAPAETTVPTETVPPTTVPPETTMPPTVPTETTAPPTVPPTEPQPTEPKPTECSHTYQTETVAATCTAAGKETKTCTKCGAQQTKTLPATGHAYGAGTVLTPAATCANMGTIRYSCSRCGHSYESTYRGNHRFGEPYHGFPHGLFVQCQDCGYEIADFYTWYEESFSDCDKNAALYTDTIRLKEPVYTGMLSQWSEDWLDWHNLIFDVLRAYGIAGEGGVGLSIFVPFSKYGGTEESAMAEVNRFLDAFQSVYNWRPVWAEDVYVEEDGVTLYFDTADLMPRYRSGTNNMSSSKRNALIKDLVAFHIHQMGLRSGMQLYNSVGAICDYMHYNLLTYDYNYAYNSAFRGLTCGVTMCQGYSEIFQLFADYCGIQCEIVEGYIGREAHAWNKVTFSDGTIRYVDVTNLGADYLILVPWSHMAEIGFKLK